MADMGIVHFNQNRGLVELGPNAPQLYEYLDTEANHNRSWYKYYIGISAAGVIAFAVTLAVGVQTALLQTVALGALTLSISVCAVLQALTQHDTE
jgi:hypothetical protein